MSAIRRILAEIEREARTKDGFRPFRVRLYLKSGRTVMCAPASAQKDASFLKVTQMIYQYPHADGAPDFRQEPTIVERVSYVPMDAIEQVTPEWLN